MLETDFETGDIKPETDFIAIATQFTSSLTTSDRAVVTVYNTSGRRDRKRWGGYKSLEFVHSLPELV